MRVALAAFPMYDVQKSLAVSDSLELAASKVKARHGSVDDDTLDVDGR